jgi:hypothetical protein
VGYTATPFANVLINPYRVDGQDLDDLYPRDFISALPKADKYFGTERLFGKTPVDPQDIQPDEEGLDMIRDVPEEDEAGLQPRSRKDRDAFQPVLTPSLEAAILYFLACCAARRARGHADQHMTMLVHTSAYVRAHERVAALIQGWVDVHPGLPLTGQGLVGVTPGGLPSDVLLRRPDVRAAEQQLLAANANIGAARAAFLPRITLTTSIGTASSQLSGLFRSGSFGWSFAPQIILPIFDGGRNQANLDAAQVGRAIAVAQYERAIQVAFREVADALATRATLADQLRAQTAQADAESGRLKLVDLRFDAGTASAFERLDAQRATFAARQAVVQLQLQQAQSLVAVYKTLGGGWKE